MSKINTVTMKSTKDLRGFLTGQMQSVVDGDFDPSRARGVTNIAQQIYNTLLIEVKVAKARADLDGAPIDPIIFDE